MADGGPWSSLQVMTSNMGDKWANKSVQNATCATALPPCTLVPGAPASQQACSRRACAVASLLISPGLLSAGGSTAAGPTAVPDAVAGTRTTSPAT